MEAGKDNGKSGVDLQNWLEKDAAKCKTGLDLETALSFKADTNAPAIVGGDATLACVQLYYEIPDDTLTHAAIAKALTKSWYDLKDKFDYTKG
jgi:hypothetical protein